jgi:hypothetical protein
MTSAICAALAINFPELYLALPEIALDKILKNPYNSST